MEMKNKNKNSNRSGNSPATASVVLAVALLFSSAAVAAAQPKARGAGASFPLLAMAPGGMGPGVMGPAAIGPGGIGPGGIGQGPGRLLPILLKSAKLSLAQKRRVREILESRRPVFEKLFSELRRAHDKVADRMFSPGEIDTVELEAELDTVSALRTRLMREGMNTILEVRNLLTPEQRRKVAAAKARFDSLRSEMRELFDGGNSASGFMSK